jgi:hypothetical protein
MRKLLRAWCVCAVALLASCQGDEDGTQQKSSSEPAEPAAVQATKPITLTTDSTGLVQKTTALGTTVNLEGRFQSAVLVRRNSDGTLSTACHDEEAAAEAFLQGAGPSGKEVK